MADPSGGQPVLLSVLLRGGDSLDLFADYLRGRNELLPLAELIWAGPVPDPTAPLSYAAITPPALGVRLRDGRQRIYVAADPPDTPRMLEAIFSRRPDLRAPFPMPMPAPFPPPPGYGVPPWAAPPPGHVAESTAPPTSSSAPPPGAAASGWTGPLPPPPPGAGFAPSYPPPYYPPAYPPFGPAPAPGSSNNETLLAGLSHLSVFFAPIILPLIVWLATRNRSPYASQQAKQAFVFHLIFAGIGFVVGIVGYSIFLSSLFPLSSGDTSNISAGPVAGLFVLWGGVAVIGLTNAIFSIVGAVHAFQGKPFHYPLLGNL